MLKRCSFKVRKFAFLTIKYKQKVKLEQFYLSKSGGGVFERLGARDPAPPSTMTLSGITIGWTIVGLEIGEKLI